MTKKRTTYPSEFKAKVALAAIRGEQSINQLACVFQVHPNQITNWKKQALENIRLGFDRKSGKKENQEGALIEELYKQIGQMKVEQDFLKKKVGLLA